MSNPEETNEPIESSQAEEVSCQEKAKAALMTSAEYVRANPLPVVIGAVVIGAVLGALLAPRCRKSADQLCGVRDWLENSLDEVSSRIPEVKRKASDLQSDLADQVNELRKRFSI